MLISFIIYFDRIKNIFENLNSKIMPAILGTLLRIFAGFGIGELVDKVLPGKVTPPYAGEEDKMPKLLKWGLIVAAGAVAFSFVAKKLKLKI